MAGVTPTGFVAKTVTDVQEDTNAAVREVYGTGANVDARSRIGQFIGVLADALSNVWNLAEAVAAAFDPNSATDVLLDNLSALTLTTRKAATRSTAVITFIGTNGTVVGIDKQVGVISTENVFETTVSGTLVTAPDWVDQIPDHPAGETIKSDGSVWRALTTAQNTNGNPPTGAGPLFVDDDLIWQRLGAGSAFADIAAQATETGPIQAFAGSLVTIVTPVAGVTATFNSLDANPGTNRETDTELRARRSLEVAAQGTSTLGSIYAEISRLRNVTSVSVYENITDYTVDSIPPHAFEALVEGGDQEEIAQTILVSKPAGIATYGNVAETGVTIDGVTRDVYFSRPTLLNVWVVVSLVKDQQKYPINGDTQIQEWLAAWGDTQPLGRDVVSAAIVAQVFQAVPGVLDVQFARIGTAPSPGSTATIVMSNRQRADYDTTRITVSSVAGTP